MNYFFYFCWLSFCFFFVKGFSLATLHSSGKEDSDIDKLHKSVKGEARIEAPFSETCLQYYRVLHFLRDLNLPKVSRQQREL